MRKERNKEKKEKSSVFQVEIRLFEVVNRAKGSWVMCATHTNRIFRCHNLVISE